MANNEIEHIYICDDHLLFAESLKAYFSLHNKYIVVGYSNNVLQSYDDIIQLHPSIILIDYQLKSSTGIDLLKKIKRSNISAHCFILTMKNDPDIKIESKLLGASGYLLKEISGDAMIAIFEQSLQNPYVFYDYSEFAEIDSSTDSKYILTKRELEIAKLVCKGYSSNEIASELHLSVLTVSTHRKHILKKLDVKNPVELLRKLQ
jgi:DNA-binding NarL/FixJ family response regulator